MTSTRRGLSLNIVIIGSWQSKHPWSYLSAPTWSVFAGIEDDLEAGVHALRPALRPRVHADAHSGDLHARVRPPLSLELGITSSAINKIYKCSPCFKAMAIIL